MFSEEFAIILLGNMNRISVFSKFPENAEKLVNEFLENQRTQSDQNFENELKDSVVNDNIKLLIASGFVQIENSFTNLTGVSVEVDFAKKASTQELVDFLDQLKKNNVDTAEQKNQQLQKENQKPLQKKSK